MLLHPPSLCDSTHSSYFDRSHAQLSRQQSHDISRSESPSITAMNAISRKRPRINPHQYSETPRTSSSYNLVNSVSSLDCASPALLANTDYCLFGGLDTPGAWSEQRLERADELDAERDYRRNRFSEAPSSTPLFDKDAALLQMNKEHVDAVQRSSTSNNSWHVRKAAWALTGGLAGKIINFCWNTTFRGFQAGDGQAYTNYAEAVTRCSPDSRQDNFLRRRVHIPGSFPGDRRSFDGQGQHSEEPLQFCRTPVVYSRHVSEDSVTKNSWVLVEHNQSNDQDQSPVRKRSRASVAGGRHDVVQPIQGPRSYTASFASPRRTTSTASVQARPLSANKRPRALLASPSRRQSSLATGQQSPASPEIESFQRKRRKESKKQDESLRRLNAQLQDMIREGQQALGSKIEIFDGHNTDEGYFDDDVR